jgi:hypothetical protein
MMIIKVSAVSTTLLSEKSGTLQQMSWQLRCSKLAI